MGHEEGRERLLDGKKIPGYSGPSLPSRCAQAPANPNIQFVRFAAVLVEAGVQGQTDGVGQLKVGCGALYVTVELCAKAPQTF